MDFDDEDANFDECIIRVQIDHKVFTTQIKIHFSRKAILCKPLCRVILMPIVRPALLLDVKNVATPLWAKCEGEAHTPKSGKLESSETPENSELDCRGQISSHSSFLGVIGKVLKCRCPKWPRMSHLDICSSSYGQKKGQESNCQFDSRPLKFMNRPLPNVCR
jgi:hypothetical protein